MGKGWDSTGIANNPALWSEVLRVLKPGGHCVAFSGTRTYHRMACAIEDAGFEVRDQLAWTYGQGFPKSMDISKAIDKAAGAEPILTGEFKRASIQRNGDGETWEAGAFASHPEETKRVAITTPATDAARQWEGWGTNLKPAWECICLARKPLSEKTVAANVLRWGTGALNIDGCRVEAADQEKLAANWDRMQSDKQSLIATALSPKEQIHLGGYKKEGRFPANLCHDGSQEVLDLFPETKSTAGLRGEHADMRGDNYNRSNGARLEGSNSVRGHTDSGSAARFFYCAKASKADRAGSRHPTVKPIKLMQWLCRMVTPPGGTVLDPFAGSGTTGAAAIIEGFQPLLIERELEYIADIKNRLYYKDTVICGAGAL